MTLDEPHLPCPSWLWWPISEALSSFDVKIMAVCRTLDSRETSCQPHRWEVSWMWSADTTGGSPTPQHLKLMSVWPLKDKGGEMTVSS